MIEAVVTALPVEVVECWAVLLPDNTLARRKAPGSEHWPLLCEKADIEERLKEEDPRSAAVKVRCTIEVIT
jgi:hypothetical protein